MTTIFDAFDYRLKPPAIYNQPISVIILPEMHFILGAIIAATPSVRAALGHTVKFFWKGPISNT